MLNLDNPEAAKNIQAIDDLTNIVTKLLTDQLAVTREAMDDIYDLNILIHDLLGRIGNFTDHDRESIMVWKLKANQEMFFKESLT